MENTRDKKYQILFGANLRKIRLSKNLSQDDLTHKANLSKNQVGRIERGEVKTTIITLRQIAEALKIPPADLLKFDY